MATWNSHSRSEIGSNRSAWMCAIPFQPCSKLCHPFRVTTAAYGQNTAFKANLGPLSAPMATWNGHSRSENWFQQVGLDVCYPVPALFQAVPPIQGHHGCLWPEHCIYGEFGASFSPYGHLERPFQVRKLVPAGWPGCVLSRSSLVPSCATHSGSPRLPMARTLHLWPIWGLFQPLWPPGTAIPGPKIGSNRSAWMCAIPFQPCSKLCHPFRVTTAAYGQNTAFMANLGPLSAPMATWNDHSRSAW